MVYAIPAEAGEEIKWVKNNVNAPQTTSSCGDTS